MTQEPELPFALPHGRFDRYVSWSMERKRVLVRRGVAGMNRLLIWTIVSFLALLGMVVVSSFNTGWAGVVARTTVGACVALVSTMWMQSALSYRSGWLEGRRDALQVVRDAYRAGDNPEDAMNAIQIHDAMFVLGLGPQVPDDPRGLDSQ